MEYVLIELTPTSDNMDEKPICVHAVVESRRILGANAIFGVYGDWKRKDEGDFAPFILYSDGRVDFGTGYENAYNDRFAAMDLRTVVISDRERVTWSSKNHGTKHFRITSVRTLPASSQQR